MRRLIPGLAMVVAILAAAWPPPACAAFAESDTPPRTSAELERWWSTFADPELARLVDEALAGNQDIAQAMARLAQAEARFGGSKGARLPTLTAGLSTARAFGGPAPARNAFDGTLALGWEPDLFGGQKEARKGARAELSAAGYDLASVQRAVIAELASSYVLYRGIGARIANTREAVETQRRILAIIRHRFELGIALAVNVEQAQLQLLQTEALLPLLDDARNRASNRIAILAGLPPGELDGRLGVEGRVPQAATLPAMDMPADLLLRRRPEVMAAEQRAFAARAGIGMARAALYPRLSLSGMVAASSFSLASLADNIVSSIFGGLTQTLFDGGQRRAALREQQALEAEALAAYRSAVLKALEDIANAASAWQSADNRLRINTAARDAAVRNADQSRGQYAIGLIDLFILLDAEQQLLVQRDEVIISEIDRADAGIALFTALGGGW